MNMKSILQRRLLLQQKRRSSVVVDDVSRGGSRRRYYHELSYASHGEPMKVLSYKSDSTIQDGDPPTPVSPPKDDDDDDDNLIKIKMLHVPWNPADVNTVQGKYPYPAQYDKPKNVSSRYFNNDSVIGSEGWGRVVAASSTNSSNKIPVGSLVTMGIPGMGTLRSSIWVPESSVIQVPEMLLDKLGPITLFQLGGTAWRMLQDFVVPPTLDASGGSGEKQVLLQNAGNSGVGLMTSQLATTMLGMSVVSIIRRGSKTDEEYNELVDYLKTVGKNALVAAEEDLYDDPANLKAFQLQLKELSGAAGSSSKQQEKLPSLALNAVGGKSAKLLLKSLETGGTMVTYGGMSAEPVVVGTPQLIFKDLRIVGYWHSRWMLKHSLAEKQTMVDELVKAVTEYGVQCPPVEVFPLRDVEQALHWQSNQKGGIRSKLVWDCQEEEHKD